jgi:TolB-like protein/tetratricopeptide (TPR) repeat protein
MFTVTMARCSECSVSMPFEGARRVLWLVQACSEANLRASWPRRILRETGGQGQEMSGEAPESGGGHPPTDPPAPGQVHTASSPVFISYSSQDVAIADAIVQILERHGLTCWIAPRDVTPGEFYADAIVRGLNAARALVLVLTENSVSSPHVLREVERTCAKRHPIISFRVGSVFLPPALEYFLSASHWLDVSPSGVDTALPKLVAAVRLCASTSAHQTATAAPAAGLFPQSPGSTPARQRPGRSLTALVAVTAVIVGYLIVDKPWLAKPVASERPGVAVVPTAAPAAPAIPEKSVAVLPFIDMSEKRDQEYFSDGLSEELIDLLCKIPELRVPARTSSFYFKGKAEDIRTIASRLLVAHVLEGSVRKSGNHLRVTAQLVRADNGYHLWSETYDRKLDDIFKTQDEIAGAVVKALKVSLLTGEPPIAQLTTSSEAYELYLRARALISRDTSDDTLKAYADLRRAVTLDAKFALAWASLADILSTTYAEWYRVFAHAKSPSSIEGDPLQDWDSILAQMRAAAHAAAEQALKNGPGLAEGHLAMGQVLWRFDSAWTAAEKQLAMAREVEPGNARILLEAAELTINLGRVPEGIQLAQRAAALDPLGRATFVLAWGQYVSGAVDEAQLSLEKYIELYPTASRVHYRNTLLLLARGLHEAALTEIERETLSRYREAGLPLALDAMGRRNDADRAIEIAERRDGNAMAYQIAYIYAGRMDLDRTFYWLERAYRQGDPGMRQLKVDPMFKNLHGDPRYQAFLQKMRLPE